MTAIVSDPMIIAAMVLAVAGVVEMLLWIVGWTVVFPFLMRAWFGVLALAGCAWLFLDVVAAISFDSGITFAQFLPRAFPALLLFVAGGALVDVVGWSGGGWRAPRASDEQTRAIEAWQVERRWAGVLFVVNVVVLLANVVASAVVGYVIGATFGVLTGIGAFALLTLGAFFFFLWVADKLVFKSGSTG